MAASKVPNGAAPHGINGALPAYNDWPNEQGFETFDEQKEPVELTVKGKIPAYAAGILYRTGPGGYQINTSKGTTFSMSHWFDGFAQTHRFELHSPAAGEENVTRVTYHSRHTCDGLIEKIRKDGGFSAMSFGQQRDPCESLFKKVMSSFSAARSHDGKGVSGFNVGVTLKPDMPMPAAAVAGRKNSKTGEDAKIAPLDTLWLKTDNAALQQIDPTTLEPLSVAKHPKLHPDLKGPFTGAHSCTDPVTGDWYNYNLEIGRTATYRVFCVSAKTGETKILATISGTGIRPAYLHSIMLTERYVVICIFGAYYAKNGLQILWTRNMLDAMEFDPHQRNVWLVIDRRETNKGLVGIYTSDPFFAFHPVNAWDAPSATNPGKFDILTDIPAYDNLDVLTHFYYHNMKSAHPSAHASAGAKADSSRPRLTRWKLPAVGADTVAVTSNRGEAQRVFTAPRADTPELPTFNPIYATKPSRYIFGVCDRGHSTFVDGILKFDTHMQTAKTRIVHAQSPGEPIFVPDPEGRAEDEGVLLSVVLDGEGGGSYLLCLDAGGLGEVGRVEVGRVVPFGFHGVHVAAL
ncbi:hypothetical protein MMC21_007993 [Puttea exsequens]|nr:hypothetical protein [Puttea exsequens]